jgi:hypothetical protein
MTEGSFIIFFERPIALGILIFDIVLLGWTSMSGKQKRAIAEFFKRLLGIDTKLQKR